MFSTFFPMRNGTGLMGEAGPEGILPLSRIGGKLGVNAEGLSGPKVLVNVINNSSESDVTTQESVNSQGERQIDVIIGSTVKKQIAQGDFDRTFKDSFGISRRGI